MALRAPGGAEWAGGYGGLPSGFRDTAIMSPSSTTHASLVAASAVEQEGRQAQAEWKQTAAKGEALMAKGQQMYNEDMVRQISMLSNKFQTDMTMDINGVPGESNPVPGGAGPLADASMLIDGQAQAAAGLPPSGIRNRKGMDAQGSTLEFQGKWGGKIDEYVKGSGLDGKFADTLRAQLYGDVSVATRAVAAHEASQRQVAYDEMNKLTVDAEGEKARLMGMGGTWNIHQVQGMFDNALAKLSVNIQANGPQERAQVLQKARGFLIGKYVDGMIDTNPKAAEDLVNQLRADMEGKQEAGVDGEPGKGPLMPLEELDKLQQKARMVRVDRVTGDLVKSTTGMAKAKRDLIIDQRAESEGFLAAETRHIKSWADAEEAQAKHQREMARQDAERAVDEKAGRIFAQKGVDGFQEIQALAQGANIGLTKKAAIMGTVQHLKAGLDAQDGSNVERERLLAAAMVPGMIQNLQTEVLDNPLLGTKSKQDITHAFYQAQGHGFAALQQQQGKQAEADIARVRETILKDVLGAADKGKTAYGVTWDQARGAAYTAWASEALHNAKSATEAAQILQKGLAEFGSSGFMGGPNFTRAEYELAADRPYLIPDQARLKKIQDTAKDKIPQDVYGTLEGIFTEQNRDRVKAGKLPVPMNGATLFRLYESATPAEWQVLKKKRTLTADAPAGRAPAARGARVSGAEGPDSPGVGTPF